MAKDQKDTPANPLSNADRFLQENKKSLSVIGGAIVVLVLLYVGYQKYYLSPRSERAANEMFRAEEYLQVDSLTDRAIKGDGSFPGFEKIAEEYSNTKSANLANVYLGGLYLKKGEYQKAIDALGKYSRTGSPVIDPLVMGMLGDAYSELKDYDNAATFYKRASSRNENSFTSPLFLKKLGLVYEEQKDYAAALDAYKKVKSSFPTSPEASSIDAYIARTEARSGN